MIRRIQGAAFTLAGLGSMAEAWRITTTVRETATFDVLGPDRYLMLAGGLMVLAGLLLMVAGRAPVADEMPAAAAAATGDGVPAPAMPAVMLAALAGFALAMPWAGFEASCLGFFLAAFGLVSRWDLPRSLIAAAVAAAVLHVVFVRLADVPLPRGVWQAWLGG